MGANTSFRLELVFGHCVIDFDKTYNYIFQKGVIKHFYSNKGEY